MSFAPIPEYEGKSPYVFITYAQQDEKIAYSIAVKMYNEGFRIWSSAACGNPSNMRIAERLSNSSVAMVFLSKNYLKYASYNEFEPRIVMSNPKKKIVICLDDTPLGTEWNTVDFPAGIRYNPDFPQELWLRINSSDALEACRGAWPSKPMPLPFQDAPAIKVSVDSLDENELAGELNSLNSVMSSFGAGLDDDDISHITLFQNKTDNNKLSWNDRAEPSQDQEYYAIENFIDNAPMPAEKKQYDSMVGLIENFMENSNESINIQSEPYEEYEYPPKVYTPVNGDYTAVPLNKFNSMDMSSPSRKPVLFTNSSGDALSYDSQQEGYTMTRTTTRPDRFTYTPIRTEPDEIITAPTATAAKHKEKKLVEEKPVFEKIVDDRKLMTSTEDNMDGAKLTYHLGILDSFNEADYIDPPEEEIKPEPKPEPIKPISYAEPSKYQPVDHTPVRFSDDDFMKPALSFDKPKPAEPELEPIELPKINTSKRLAARPLRRLHADVRKHWRVGVQTRINHIEYGSEMFKVDGRWIPSQIYYAKMPKAKYTEVKYIKPKEEPVISSPMPRNNYKLNVDSRLFGAVNTFRSPRPQTYPVVDSAEEVRRIREARYAEAARRFEEERAAAAAALAAYSSQPSANNYYGSGLYSNQNYYYNQPTAQPVGEEEKLPARKHKYIREVVIGPSVEQNTSAAQPVEEVHRQYGVRAESVNIMHREYERAKPIKEDTDDDSFFEIPSYSQPKINYDPKAYRDMNLSEILFSDIPKDDKKPKKKKKK